MNEWRVVKGMSSWYAVRLSPSRHLTAEIIPCASWRAAYELADKHARS